MAMEVFPMSRQLIKLQKNTGNTKPALLVQLNRIILLLSSFWSKKQIKSNGYKVNACFEKRFITGA